MKLFTQWRFILLAAFFSILGAGNVWAQLTELEVGKVYHFTNVGYDKAMGATVPNSVAGVNVAPSNYTQLWYVESTDVKNEVPCYTLRNLAFGTYLQGNGQSSRWTLASTTDSDNSWITLKTVGSNNAFKGYTYGGYGYAHIDGSGNVVGWSTDASATQWTISKIDMSDDAIQAALGIFNNVATYQTALNDLFSDKACTTLKSGFSESNASFLALPTTLQNMVRKVAGNTSWEEDYNNGKPAWDADYAKKYRVQWYEPYNEPECAAKALNLNAHTNLNNPTGIFANNGDVLYVMVEGEIKPGAELYLSYYTGQNRLSGATDGYELKQGLNVIPVYYDESNFCVNYVVHTFDTSEGKKGNKAKARKLSEYAPLKIHIEGGYINGYWNKMGDALYPGDTDENWNYIEARATQKDIVVLGKYMTLKFPLLSEHAQGNSAMSQIYNDMVSVSASIAEWDNIMLWERFLMGLSTKAELDDNNIVSPYSRKTVFAFTGEDYTDYYNVHGLAINVEDNKNPHAGWDYTGYPNYSLKSVNADVIENAGAHWTAGHEIGHQHQGPLNMRGLTEVTNNLFSNVVLWCFGKSTSRYNGTDGALSNVLAQFNAEGTDFFSNNIWAQTIMYYKLFLYYHVLGHDPQFYPRLFEMLRQNPMIIEGDQDGSKCLMHFYKLCCEAAGEDLTEFFRAHGFFEVMNSRFVGDYSSATYNLTQAQIDQAITEVKAKDYPVNLAVLFINDATGEEILSHKGGTLELYGETRVCSEIGSYSNFNGDAANYTYGVAGNLVTMEGEGGVGFAILNEKGELIGFSDKKTFELSAEAAAAIASGKASIVSIKGDNTPVVATNVMDSDNIGTKYELLGELLDNSKFILTRADATGTKVGFYRESALEGLQRAYDKAKVVYDAMAVSAYVTAYEILFQEYVNILSNDFARVNITDGYAYRLTNKAYSNLSMAVGDGEKMLGLETTESDNQLWYFEPGVTKNTYYLKNKGTKKYPGEVESGQVLSANKSEADKGKNDGAYAYRLQEMQPGVFALVGETGLHCSASQNYNIVGWGADADASQWYITAIALDEALEARTKLEELIGKTEALVNEIAEYTLVNKLELQTEDNSAANYLSTNACHNTLNNASDGQGLAGLLDESTGTYFHSDYHGTVKDPHYLQVDLGANHTVEQFKFNYTTRANGNNCPLTIKVEGSTDGSTFVELKTFTAAKDGLPNGNALSWESPVISNEGNYRYLRFTVTEAEGQNSFFVMSTFGLSDVTPVVNEIKEGYANDASKEALKTQIKATLYELADAHQLVDGDAAEASVYNEEIEDLDYYYQELLKVVNNKLNAALDTKKAKLDDLITLANTLIKECGTVTFTPGTFDGRAKLQTTDENDRFYIWTNAQELDEGPIANLIDGDIQTYFHSDYSGTNSTDELAHHLTVNLGTGVTASSFQFSYTTRHDADANYPKTIKVYGSTDGKNFDDNEVAVITGLTAENSWTYNSDVITESKEFTHLRFMVTENNNNNIQGGHPIFHMAEFSLTINGRPENYAVTLNNNIGIVDEALLVAAYKEKEEAVYVKANAITETQIDEAIADLQAQYDALLAAMNADPLRAERETANEFLNSTPETVGYPVAAEREKLQKAIAEATTAAAIDAAVLAFKTTANINMPENGKAYKIKAWWKNEQRYMAFVKTEDANVFAGSEPAYVPVQDASKAVTFVCRKIDDNTYAFVSDNGYYLGWQADGKKNNTSQNFAVHGYDNTLKIQKAEVNNNGTILQAVDLFGTLNILGKNASDYGVYYHFMFNKVSKNYHSGNRGDSYYNNNEQYGHTVYYTFVEDTDYTLNTIKMNKLEGKNQLLTGLEEGMSMSTFSAPYPTVTPEGITAYYAKAISTTTEDGESKDVAVLQKMRTAIPAGQGVVLVGEVGKSGNFKMLPAAGEEVPADLDNHKFFKGTGAQSVEMGKNGVDYILGKGSKGAGFYKAKAGSTLAAGKAYFHFENAAQVRNFVLRFGGETTDIEDAVLAPATDNDAIYDLSGRRVNEVTKGGIYIKNGKKFIVK